MNNTFQIAKSTTNLPNTNGNNDKASFKESITGIEKFWNELNTDLDKKMKDKEELKRMYVEYQTDEFSYLIEVVGQEIDRIRTRLNLIQRVMWDVRTRLLFTDI